MFLKILRYSKCQCHVILILYLIIRVFNLNLIQTFQPCLSSKNTMEDETCGNPNSYNMYIFKEIGDFESALLFPSRKRKTI